MTQPIRIITYECRDADPLPGERWLAYIVRQTYRDGVFVGESRDALRFCADSKADVIAKAVAFHERERRK